MIKTLIFDLGNVLLHFSNSKLVKQVADICGRSVEDVESFFYRGNLSHEFELGKISSLDIYELFKEFSQKKFSKEELFLAVSDIFIENKSLVKVLEKAKEKGYRLVLLSNTNEVHFDFIKENYSYFLKYFDDMVLSYKEGVCKPMDRIYQIAIERSLCAPEECYYTDDIEQYIKVAKDHKISASQFTSTELFLESLMEVGVDFS